MRTKAIACLMVLSVVLVGCSAVHVPGAVTTERGTLLFSAEGSSPIMKADDPLALLEARTAAAAIAKANLLEKIKGAYVASNVEVRDLTFAAESAGVSTEGLLSRVVVTYAPLERTGQMAMVVTAVASLELTCDQFMDLGSYVE